MPVMACGFRRTGLGNRRSILLSYGRTSLNHFYSKHLQISPPLARPLKPARIENEVAQWLAGESASACELAPVPSARSHAESLEM